MKSTRSARGPRSVWGRVAGYGAALLLVGAAIVVLLVPMLEKGRGGGAGATGAAATPEGGAAPAAGVPGATGPSNPAPQQNRTGQPYPGGGQQPGGGPAMPGQGGSGAGLSSCPSGTALYRQAIGGTEVVVRVSGSGAVRAEITASGHSAAPQQATVRDGKPHVFRFKGVPAQQVQRVKVTTVSVGAAMQSCYARPGA
ncbi:hypothetical protein [Actinomadura xylanilytica]|uniref:hypothetical protein n=1 Tax=Actinomadura xylanilytica TaxID=887459 RepID=UPI00255AB634|nr:hypothetical protein [Actinomadura xylanilytica]MDL4777305.1 hypothetical protein [Actinomadura xylanilytica]